MPSGAPRVPLLVAVLLLFALLYPALVLDHRVAPEASLKSAPPWRELWGPYPAPSANALQAATRLGPRLASAARGGLGVAIWNPWIGGGRPGWLASAEAGGAPLPLLAALSARPGWTWTALVALELLAALLGAGCVLRWLGLGWWPAAVGATAYALSGAVAGCWLDWRGSALALGPIALIPVVAPLSRPRARLAAWTVVLIVLVASGSSAIQFVALAGAVMALLERPQETARAWLALAGAAVLALMVSAPRLWLEAAGQESGAPLLVEQASPPVRGVGEFVVPARSGDLASTHAAESLAAPIPRQTAYLGLVTLALAAMGAVLAPSRPRGFWLGVTGACLVVALLPGAVLARAGVVDRPFGVLALAVAVLAAYGVQGLAGMVPSARGAAAVCALVWLILAVAMIPAAASRLPFVAADEAELAPPIPAEPGGPDVRVLGLLGTLPPDVSATLGLADVRATSFRGEPRYAAALGATRGGDIPVSRALDPRIAMLGARLLLEPVSLNVISGEVFSRIEPAELAPSPEDGGAAIHRFRAEVPPGACRIGIPSSRTPPSLVSLESQKRSAALAPDPALATESAAWQWFAIPAGWPPGEATLTVQSAEVVAAVKLPVAWDTSGLRLSSEHLGIRVWEWSSAPPMVSLAYGVRPESAGAPPDRWTVAVPDGRLAAMQPLAEGSRSASVRTLSVAPSRIEARVEARKPALLVVQVKYRPALWRATVNGASAAVERCNQVWTGFRVPAGGSRVVVEARVSPWAWSVAGLALAAIALVAVPRRRP